MSRPPPPAPKPGANRPGGSPAAFLATHYPPLQPVALIERGPRGRHAGDAHQVRRLLQGVNAPLGPARTAVPAVPGGMRDVVLLRAGVGGGGVASMAVWPGARHRLPFAQVGFAGLRRTGWRGDLSCAQDLVGLLGLRAE